MINFKDLSIPLKIGIVASWVLGILYVLVFIVSFIEGVLTV